MGVSAIIRNAIMVNFAGRLPGMNSGRWSGAKNCGSDAARHGHVRALMLSEEMSHQPDNLIAATPIVSLVEVRGTNHSPTRVGLNFWRRGTR